MQYKEFMIDVPGGQVWSQLIYTDEGKDKPPLICLHGGPGSTHDKIKYGLEALANEFPLIFYDQLGGGKSALPDEDISSTELWKIERFVDELAALIEFYNIDQFNLFGNSWGSSLALEYMLSEYQPKPQKLILSSPLISTSMWLDDVNQLKSELPVDTYNTLQDCEYNDNTDSEEYRLAMDEFYNRHVLRISNLSDEQLEFMAEHPSTFNMDAYAYMWGPSEFYVTGTLIDYERFDDLVNLDLPVLFIGGEFDEATPSSLKLFQQQVVGAELEIVPNTSHSGFFEAPAEYAELIRQFINK